MLNGLIELKRSLLPVMSPPVVDGEGEIVAGGREAVSATPGGGEHGPSASHACIVSMRV